MRLYISKTKFAEEICRNLLQRRINDILMCLFKKLECGSSSKSNHFGLGVIFENFCIFGKIDR